eukprot:GFUD01088245.1.p2 GENE.GFUD01088245.1~~GFUD01088245.1.p2  ORF type:complete len:103 (-),score=24.88 GFUD01088245.1:342-650(-)
MASLVTSLTRMLCSQVWRVGRLCHTGVVGCASRLVHRHARVGCGWVLVGKGGGQGGGVGWLVAGRDNNATVCSPASLVATSVRVRLPGLWWNTDTVVRRGTL